MFARIRKTTVTTIATVLAIASTGFGAIFLAAFITVASGNAPTETAQKPTETPVTEKPKTAIPTPAPVIAKLQQSSPTLVADQASESTAVSAVETVKSQGVENSTVPQVVEYADYIAKEPDSMKRTELAAQGIKCNLKVNDFSLDDISYLKFLTLVSSAQSPSTSSGNNRYFLAKNIVRYMPEKGRESWNQYNTIMCQSRGASIPDTSFLDDLKESTPVASISESSTPTPERVDMLVQVTDADKSGLNCRAVPVNGQVVKTFVQGTEFRVYEKSGDWYKTQDNCWVSSKLVREIPSSARPLNSGGYTPEEAQLEASINQSVPVVETQSYASSGSGRCDTPDQLDSRGRRCGGRAASVRPGGRHSSRRR